MDPARVASAFFPAMYTYDVEQNVTATSTNNSIPELFNQQ